MNAELPLTRMQPWYPGQMGVPGSDTERGLRTHVTGTVYYVDPNYVDNDDRRDGTDPEAPLTTVAAALSKCEAYHGDVVLVMANSAWEYDDPSNAYGTIISESVVVTVGGVRIIGVAPFSPIGVPWQAAADGQFALTIEACDVLVEGFGFVESTVTGTSGISIVWGGIGTGEYGDDVIVRRCYFSNDLIHGIQMEFVWHGVVEDCEFDGCDYGIYVDPAGQGIAYCDIRNNRFQDCPLGAISVPGANDCRIHHNSVYNGDAQGAALATDLGIITAQAAVVGQQNMVFENWLSCLLPVPANGDYDDFCTAAATDAWVNNHCMNGPTVTNPT